MGGTFPRKIFYWTAGIHLVLIILFLLGYFFNPLTKEKPHEIVTYMDVPAMAPVEAQPEPAPEPPRVEPPKPEPPKPKKVIKKSNKRIKRQERPPPPPQKTPRKVDPDKLKELLSRNVPKTQNNLPPSAFPSSYLALVRQKMYDAWRQPSELQDSSLVAVVKIRISRNGSITQRNMLKASGNAVMDQSIMTAVRSVSRIKPLPASYNQSYRDVEVEFMLTGTVL